MEFSNRIVMEFIIWVTKTDVKNYFKISFARQNEAAKHDLIKFNVQCLEVFCCHGKILILKILILNFKILVKF